MITCRISSQAFFITNDEYYGYCCIQLKKRRYDSYTKVSEFTWNNIVIDIRKEVNLILRVIVDETRNEKVNSRNLENKF